MEIAEQKIYQIVVSALEDVVFPRFDEIEKRLSDHDKRFEAIDKRFDTMERRMDDDFANIRGELHQETAKTNGKIDDIKKMLEGDRLVVIKDTDKNKKDIVRLNKRVTKIELACNG